MLYITNENCEGKTSLALINYSLDGICGMKIPSTTDSRSSDTFEPTLSALRMVNSTTIWVNGENLTAALHSGF